MNANENNRIDDLLQAHLLNQLTDDQQSELRSLLKNDPEALDRYLDFCELDEAIVATSLPAAASCRPLIHRPDSLGAGAGAPSKRLDSFIVAASILWIIAGLAVVAWVGREQASALALNRSAAVPTVVVGRSDSGIAKTGEASTNEASNATSNILVRNEWKTIQSTGSVKHPPLTEMAVPVTNSELARPIKFNRDIRPILSETCFHCHGPDEEGRRADLRLDTAAGGMKDLGGYQPIVAGDLGKSEAWQRIISDDADLLMPPPESHLVLNEEQKQLIRRWIEEGAEYEGHWAFVTPTPPEVPEMPIQNDEGTPWGKNAIDSFVAARMVEAGLTPSPEANPRTLIRRLSLDLIGLPPTLDEVRAFVDDYEARGDDAWQDAITRLLESPHFGERMAIPWLDQARYADTNGYSIDGGRDMWLWRDWVINAYNENLPFDQFLVHQIAGDLLPNATDAERIATGFNRNHMVTHEGGTIPEENLTNYAADRVKTTSEVFLGLTMGCSQCHDHKYDPISQKEYYQFFAFFNELSDKGLDGNAGRNPAPHIMTKTVLPKDELAGLEEELAALEHELLHTREGFDEWLSEAQAREAARGNQFQTHAMKTLDVSSPNRPGEFTVQEDGSVLFVRPAGGLNAMSHVMELPKDLAAGQTIDGIRVRFFPYGEGESRHLTPHPAKVPQVTTVLVSAGKQPAKQVDIYRQKSFAQATASSSAENRSALNVLDERNVGWWMPTESTQEQHLTLTFDEPIDVGQSPYLSVMLFFGVSKSLPHEWKIEAFSGVDTDSVYSDSVAETLSIESDAWTERQREVVMQAYREDAFVLDRLRVRIANLKDRIHVLTQPHSTMVMDTAPKPRETFVLARGQYDAHGDKVSPATLEVLPELQPSTPLGSSAPSSQSTESTDIEEPNANQANRLDLARWMIHPDHPLTARVAVNRLWSLYFGVGIVATSADFGSQGEWPSHPELIDYLATEFVANDWDQKELIRRIVSSATYRQDSFASEENRRIDPKNRLLARGPSFRLSAELVRDQALAVSGLLVRRIGGPSVHPYQPAGLWKEVSHFGSTPATKQVFVQDRGEKLYRRSLYTITKRTSPHPSMSAFDAPNREMCTVQRGVTNTPLQALVTLNDTQFVEASRVFAANLLHDSTLESDEVRMQSAFEQVTSRLAKPEEMAVLIRLLGEERKRYQLSPEQAAATTTVGESPVTDDLDPVEHAAWTQVASLLMNLSEALTHL